MKKSRNIFMSALVGLSFFVMGDRSVRADDLSNPAVFSTNAAYAATAGYALISKDGTNALDLLTQETNRSITYDTNLLAITVATTARVAAVEAVDVTTTGRVAALEAVDITTTGRVAVLEASTVTVTGQVAALQAVDITTTGRVAALEAVDITTTGRVYTLELSNVTVTGQVAALQDVDITTTGRVYALEQADISTTQRVASVEATTNGAVLGLTAYQPNATNFLTEGYWDVVDTTQLVFIAGAVTNVIDADITTNP